MKHRFAVITLLVFSLCAPLAGMTHEAADPLHATPVETVESWLATPTNIHVQETDNGVEVKGILKRRTSHKNERLHGHIDVELLDKEGQPLERVTLPLRARSVPARFDREREFSTILPAPSSPGYTIRVSHSIGTDDHQ